MRKPVQVLVLPYRHCKNKIQFALFKRADLNVWQGIAGGVEEGESVFEAYNVPIRVDTIRRRYPIKWTCQEGIGTLIVNTKIWVF